MNGILNVLKPAGMTSFDVISFLRRTYKQKKIGHGGTLDPMAAGVLPVFMGKATRLIEYAPIHTKTYIAEFIMGFSTDTEDVMGNIISSGKPIENIKVWENACESFKGDILQVPSLYSAIKVRGQRAYDLARSGEFIELKPRPIHIYDISLLEASKLVKNDISSAALKNLENFNNLISMFKEMIENTTTSVILENLIKEIGYYEYLKLEEISSIQNKKTEEGILLLPNFLENIMLNSASDDIKNDEEYVKLMTVHSSKGLEFNTVFLTGLEENLFPRLSLLENLDEEEEERRIFYVAVTRAEELLFITHSLERATFGFTSRNPRSRFLDELNENNIEILENPNLIAKSPKLENSFSVREYLKNNSIQSSKENIVTIECDFELKEIVSHKEFGKGIITEITPKSITVKFSIGAKKFPTKIANKFLKKEFKL